MLWYRGATSICSRLCKGSSIIVGYHTAMVIVASRNCRKLRITVVDYCWILQFFLQFILPVKHGCTCCFITWDRLIAGGIFVNIFCNHYLTHIPTLFEETVAME